MLAQETAVFLTDVGIFGRLLSRVASPVPLLFFVRNLKRLDLVVRFSVAICRGLEVVEEREEAGLSGDGMQSDVHQLSAWVGIAPTIR
jgi:hypothetical protein